MRGVATPRTPGPEPLRFLVDFARLELDRLTPAGWADLRAHLVELLTGGEQQPAAAPITMVDIRPEAAAWPKDLVRRLQVDIRELLERLVSQREGLRTGQLGPAPAITLTRAPRLWLVPLGPRGRTLRMVDGLPVDDAVRYAAWDLLGREPSPRVQRCPEARCGRRLFYRVRRQRFCSTRCLYRAIKRRKRERQADVMRKKDKQRKARRHRRPKGGTP
jgi:hypothetical protein